MDNGMRLLQRAEEAGLTVTRNGEHLRIRGPKSAESIVKELSRHKNDVLAALEHKDSPEDELRARLRKGVEWFIAADKKLWDDNNRPVMIGSELEYKFVFVHMDKWDELERLLRNLYEYKGCIFTDGSCPESSPVKCSACG
tara:strand:- start:613 stop:1035 length:423 start_codon:yes stop_codon:yes gene_type:complete